MQYNGTEITLKFGEYTNGRLSLCFYDKEGYLYGVPTVNIPDEPLSNPNCSFIDTNNMPGVDEWIDKNNIGKFTNNIGMSGYCIYPEFEFNKKFLN